MLLWFWTTTRLEHSVRNVRSSNNRRLTLRWSQQRNVSRKKRRHTICKLTCDFPRYFDLSIRNEMAAVIRRQKLSGHDSVAPNIVEKKDAKKLGNSHTLNPFFRIFWPTFCRLVGM